MAITATVQQDEHVTTRHLKHVKIDLDSSYPTGGEAITANNLGLGTVEAVIIANVTGGYVASYDYTNAKIIMYEAGADGAPLDEVANTTDLSAVDVYVLALGH